jgi:sulfite dehydrogenase (quinone) subunit SoeA
VPAATIERLALEMAHVAFEETIELPMRMDRLGRAQARRFIGRPVSMHAMRGISAHSNGFQTCRAMHCCRCCSAPLDVPGGHRAKPPYPKPTSRRRSSRRATCAPNTPLSRPRSASRPRPEDLVIDERATRCASTRPIRGKRRWPTHGLMHMVITNAVAGDPYPIDTLILFMANMAWNSTMNTERAGHAARQGSERRRIQDAVPGGDRRLPFGDGGTSPTWCCRTPPTSSATTAISLLDRPISEPDAAATPSATRCSSPIATCGRGRRCMVELAGRLKFPAFVTNRTARPSTRTTPTSSSTTSGAGHRLPGRLARQGRRPRCAASPIRSSGSVHRERVLLQARLARAPCSSTASPTATTSSGGDVGFNGKAEPIIMELYSETAAEVPAGRPGPVRRPAAAQPGRPRAPGAYFDPLPMWYEPLESSASTASIRSSRSPSAR